MAKVVVTGATADTPAVGKVFDDIAFFLVQRIPQRSQFIKDIEANGGRVVKVESQADYVIADHLRKDAPGGSYSYTFIQTAIRDGELPNPADHATRPAGEVRAVGSSVPGKQTRTPFTADDDALLWNWVMLYKEDGFAVKGYDVYKRLEQVNRRHTHQSWRERFIRYLMDRPPPVGVDRPENQPAIDLTPAVQNNAAPSVPSDPRLSAKSRQKPSSEETSAQCQAAAPVKGRAQETTLARQASTPRTASVTQQEAEVPNGQTTQDQEFSQRRVSSGGRRMLSAEDFKMLMDNAGDIEDVPHEHRREAWEAFAGACPQHSAIEWMSLYERLVKPAYLKRATKGVTKEQQPTTVQDDATRELSRVQDHEGSSESPSAKKRIRDMPQSSDPRTRKGRKKHRTETPEENGTVQSSKPVTAYSNLMPNGQHRGFEESIPTSELNGAVEQQLEQEAAMISPSSDKAAGAVHDAMITSDLNMAANLQLQQEAGEPPEEQDMGVDPIDLLYPARSKLEPEKGPGALRSETDLLTSDANRAAEMQFGGWSVREDVDDEGLPVQNRDEADSNAPETSKHALTAANLATQQAQHEPPMPRGTDIPKDDDNMDQTDFANYLGGLVGKESARKVPVIANDTAPCPGSEDSEDLPTDPFDVPARSQHLPSDQLPMSSQQEVDDVLEDGLKWPASPQQRRKQHESQDVGRWRPVSYPDLPSQSQGYATQAEAGLELSSRNLISQINGSSSPNQVDGEQDAEQRMEEKAESEIDEDEHQESDDIVNGDDVDDTNDHDAMQQDAYSAYGEVQDEIEGDIDLTIAEPDGGFNLDYSPQPEAPIDFSRLDDPRPVNKPSTARSDALFVSSGSSSPSQSSVESQPHSRKTKGGEKSHVVETQDILDAETQQPDLGMPLPPESDDDYDGYDDLLEPPMKSSARPKPQPKAAEPHTSDDAPDMASWISSMMARGYKQTSIIDALKHTSMNPDLALLVLTQAKSGKGFPDDMPGIWSDREDRLLESGDGPGLRELSEKHGWDELDARFKFLSDWREVNDA